MQAPCLNPCCGHVWCGHLCVQAFGAWQAVLAARSYATAQLLRAARRVEAVKLR